MSVGFTILPPSFPSADLESPKFRKRNHHHVDKDEHARLKAMQAIECLNEKRRIWRYVGTAIAPDSHNTGDGKLYRYLPKLVRDVMRSEMTRRPMEEPA